MTAENDAERIYSLDGPPFDRAALLDLVAGRTYDPLAGDLRATLLNRAWDVTTGRWRDYLDGDAGEGSVYPQALSILSGVHGTTVPPGVRNALLGTRRAGTPFMTTFVLQALAAVGCPDEAVSELSLLWGEMLDVGARTFWEDFPQRGSPFYEMYGREFGKSLCHAWSSGPAALLPEIVCGLRPLLEGWSRFEVRPALGGLAWSSALVPVPGGEIFVVVTPLETVVHVPTGCVLIHDTQEHSGPIIVTLRRGNSA